MSFYGRRILPHLLHFAMGQAQLRPFRQRVVGAAVGKVLEIGLGSGLNLPLYGLNVRSVIGVEPSAELLAMAERQVGRARIPVELLETSAEALPLPSSSIDTAVTTWTLCTILDAVQALREVRRVLKPGGVLLFVEHGRAPEPSIARLQDRLDRPWGMFAGGCHINRRIDALIRQSGFRIEHLAHDRMPGPRIYNYLYEGKARPE